MGKTAQLVVKGKIQVYTPTNEETVVVDWSCAVNGKRRGPAYHLGAQEGKKRRGRLGETERRLSVS